jgi:hypothetical protein
VSPLPAQLFSKKFTPSQGYLAELNNAIEKGDGEGEACGEERIVGTFGSKDLEHAEGYTIIDTVRKIGSAGIRGMLKGLEELLKPGSKNRVS